MRPIPARCIFVLAFFVAGGIYAAEPSIEWQQSFGGSHEDLLFTLQRTSDGGCILGGLSFSSASGNKTSGSFGEADYWVVKVDSRGNRLWDKSFGGARNDTLSGILQSSDGGYILSGQSYSPVSTDKTSPNYGLSDFWLVKIDSDGKKLWDKSFGGSQGDSLSRVQPTSDGGCILIGSSGSGVFGNKTSPNHGSFDYWLVKLDSEGNKLHQPIVKRSVIGTRFVSKNAGTR